MPELPEVETLKKALTREIVGKKIDQVHVLWPKTVKPLLANVFVKKVLGKKIKDVSRRAKILVIFLNDGNYLLIHLKMTGQLIFKSKLRNQKSQLIAGGHPQPGGTDNLPNAFTRLIFVFSDGSKLFFNDMRKFGWVKFISPSDFKKVSDNYGVEPLTKDFNFNFFKKAIAKYPNRKIKQWLLDQKIISGLGNIYADESCFYAKILPTRIVGSLKPKEVRDLFVSIPKVLKLSISKKGTSFSDYVQLDGQAGQMIKWLKVYNKKNQPCQNCGGIIKKMKLNGRGTHFCPCCQK